MRVIFKDVGRDDKTWEADVPNGPDFDQAVLAEIRQHGAIMSRDIDIAPGVFTDTDEAGWIILVGGCRNVGRIIPQKPEVAESIRSITVSETTISTGPMDWPLLREQKETLVDVINEIEHSDDSSARRGDTEDLQGLLHLIDHVQDEAEKTLGGAVVFGDKEESTTP